MRVFKGKYKCGENILQIPNKFLSVLSQEEVVEAFVFGDTEICGYHINV